MKPGKTFNLSKETKRRLATMPNRQQRSDYKRLMIEAQLYSEVVKSPREKK